MTLVKFNRRQPSLPDSSMRRRRALFAQSLAMVGHNNYILPWKVDRDGKVQNGLA